MRLLATSDIHQQPDKWERLCEAAEIEQPDFVLIAGDIITVRDRHANGQQHFVEGKLPQYLKRIVKITGSRRIILQMGNDDLRHLETLVEDVCEKTGVVMLNQSTARINDIIFAGMNRVRDYPFAYKAWVAPEKEFISYPVQYGLSGEKLEEFESTQRLKRTIGERLESLATPLLPGDMRRSIWLIHQPPSDVGLDILSSGEPCGSPEVLNFIQQHQPLLTVHGHIHESPYTPGGQWAALLGNTICIQCGQQGGTLDYAIVDTETRILRHSKLGESPLLLQP